MPNLSPLASGVFRKIENSDKSLREPPLWTKKPAGDAE